MHDVHVQKGNKSNSKDDKAAEVGKTSASEDRATNVILAIPTGIRIVERVILFQFV